MSGPPFRPGRGASHQTRISSLSGGRPGAGLAIVRRGKVHPAADELFEVIDQIDVAYEGGRPLDIILTSLVAGVEADERDGGNPDARGQLSAVECSASSLPTTPR